MLVLLRFTVDADSSSFISEAGEALAVLAACPGYVAGQLGRGYDDPRQWCLVTEWESVGAYRRALGSYAVKARATSVLGRADPEVSAFEVRAIARRGEQVITLDSDRGEYPQIRSRP